MDPLVFIPLAFVFGFLLAQGWYTRKMHKGFAREERLGDMLRASHARYREISAMLDRARQP